MVKKVMKSNEKRAVKAENAERRHRNLILAAVALTAAVAIVSLVLFIRTASQLKRGTNEEERTDIPVLIGNIFQQLYNMADTLIVGHTVSSDAMAGRSSFTAANPVQFGRTFRKNRLCLHGTVTEY